MASSHAIAVTALSLRGILASALSRRRFEGTEVRLVQAKDLQAPGPVGYGLSIYLHRVAYGTSPRNLSSRQMPNGRRLRPPTPVDLHFLITAWARSAEEQQVLLGWAIRTLEDAPILPAGLLNSFAGSIAGDEQDVFRDRETVELVGEILSYQDLVSIWEVSKNNQQPSVSYMARSVLIESEMEITQAGPVQTRIFEEAVLQ